MFTFDVESLYTNIPIPDAIAAVEVALRGHCLRAPLSCALHHVLHNNFMVFQDTLYKQISGIAMGTPLAPPLANIFMVQLERRAMASLTVKPLVYRRLIDDAFGIFCGDHDAFDRLRTVFSTMHPRIRLVWTVGDNCDFLDLRIMRGPTRVSFETHQKALNSYLYLPRFSFHNPPTILGYITSELGRYALNSSTAMAFYRTRHAFWLRLVDRGFNAAFLRRVFDTVPYSRRDDLIRRIVQPPASTEGSVLVLKLPYTPLERHNGVARTLQRLFDRAPMEVSAHVPRPITCFMRANNLYDHLVHSRLPAA
jgi:hypothetical protein